jgi:hypothetical protein
LYVTSIPPDVPTNVTTDNTNCGQIVVNWNDSADTSNVAGYRVYRRTSGTGTATDSWTQVGGDVVPTIPLRGGGFFGGGGTMEGGSATYTYTDSSPLLPAGSNYYAVASYDSNNIESAKIEPTITPTIPQSCNPNLSLSDLDLLSVQGHVNKTFTSTSCSGTSEVAILPNNALFSPGDVLTFRLSVCNSGNSTMTGVGAVIGFTNLTDAHVINASPAGCVTSQTIHTSDITLGLADIAAPSGGVIANSCSITYTLAVHAPTSSASAYQRFQTFANITTNSLSLRVSTPPYLFGFAAGVPNRSEVSPQ